MRESPQEGDGRAPRRRLECGGACIGVYPTGSIDAPWWTAIQIDSLDRTLVRLKRLCNVDENRVHLMGVSDGATGVYFAGLRDATPWSSLFPFNGHPRVLANPAVGADGELFLANLANTPLYIINGGQDPMYPAATLEPWVAALERAGAKVTFRPQMAAGHDTSWWPAESPLVEEYERAHPRDPLPDRLSWQTERTDRYNRFRWLIIDTLDAARAQTPPASADDLFVHRKPSGRVDLERSGNTVQARTRGVGAFTLLLSPSEFDFGQPIRVIVNGQAVFDGTVRKDVATLLRWAARDFDRTMLFGAELKVDVPR